MRAEAERIAAAEAERAAALAEELRCKAASEAEAEKARRDAEARREEERARQKAEAKVKAKRFAEESARRQLEEMQSQQKAAATAVAGLSNPKEAVDAAEAAAWRAAEKDFLSAKRRASDVGAYKGSATARGSGGSGGGRRRGGSPNERKANSAESLLKGRLRDAQERDGRLSSPVWAASEMGAGGGGVDAACGAGGGSEPPSFRHRRASAPANGGGSISGVVAMLSDQLRDAESMTQRLKNKSRDANRPPRAPNADAALLPRRPNGSGHSRSGSGGSGAAVNLQWSGTRSFRDQSRFS